MNGKRRLLGSFNHGSMANAMPQALGAQALDTRRQVVAMCGDGGFSMLMGDFISVAAVTLKKKLVVFNNSVLGFVAMEMKAGGYLTDGTDLQNPDFAAIAAACGVKGIRVVRYCWTSLPRKRSWRCRRRSKWSRRKASASICCAPSLTAAATKSSSWQKPTGCGKTEPPLYAGAGRPFF